jgi:hypothetical protein
MAGLSLGAGAQVRVGGQPTYGSVPNPTTSQQAGFGYGGTDSGGSEGLAALLPNDPAGATFWFGVASLGILLFLYWSLPN